ncbi:hypothetical protein SAMN05877838_1769 [Hoeflea halophila]|uniref:Uncharacterized protein n=1 Tax=Hoeflea halophila TaxID=714899 RepID=A0A286IC52_9HYPH|nr:hypothetical protein SAMN05877838_1769 [Hoeflea halophila]
MIRRRVCYLPASRVSVPKTAPGSASIRMIFDQTFNAVGGGGWRQPNRRFDAISDHIVPAGQMNIGATEVMIKVRRKKIAISKMIGEISRPPRSGMIRRIGLSAGSVAL